MSSRPLESVAGSLRRVRRESARSKRVQLKKNESKNEVSAETNLSRRKKIVKNW